MRENPPASEERRGMIPGRDRVAVLVGTRNLKDSTSGLGCQEL